MLSRIIVITVVIFLLCTEAGAWRRRRRRRCPTHSCSWRWGPCSRPCGGGTQRAVKTANQGACGSCHMPTHAQSCNSHCCRADCYWYSWGSWGACSRNCGSGTQTRSRGQRAASCGGSRCVGSSTQSRNCNTQCCPVHCSWGAWSSWGSCSRICGRGTQTRSRSYATAPSCGGNRCSGASTQTQNCNTQCCPVHCAWAAWSGWSSCSRNCGGGTQTRNRGHSTSVSCGGRPCTGTSRESRECNKQCCPQHCSWATWSNWGGCSVSCGGGDQQRTRAYAVSAACGGRPCPGSSRDSRRCNSNCCPVNCAWDAWASWGTCSATCGGGDQARHRVTRISASCGGRSCSGRPAESRTCNTQCCPVDCAWRSWQTWGMCSLTCGGGTQVRSRSFAVSSSCGGRSCDGVATDTRTCNGNCCPVNCEWAPWADWGGCSVSCGGGTQSRSRGEEVAKYCGGSACSGDSTQSRECNSQCCPVVCVWGDWSKWDSCSVSCGGGQQVRERAIAVPSSCHGAECVGPSSQAQTCNSQCCPVHCEWNDWSQWGACSKTCEKGTQRRMRTIAVESRCNGNECPGSDFEERFCNDVCCPVHCKWTDWSKWTQCTKTCGNGTQTRNREVHVQETCEGEECVGDNDETRSCNAHCCPVNCVITSWTTWSECSHSCGAQGTRVRSRSVSRPSSCGGTPCADSLSETENCNRICFHGGEARGGACICHDGWTGECCADDVNECDTVVCPLHSKCMNVLGSYECACDHGYTKSGKICMDIDECKLELHECHEQASCINMDGHYICRCNPGFTGNGTFCGDVNECGDDDYDNDTETDYDYFKEYANKTLGPLCHDMADCVNTHGSYICECVDGFSGDGEDCQDIDECAIVNRNNGSHLETGLTKFKCDEHATCYNIPGSYYCNCNEGFFGDGSSCKEMDECASEPCQNKGTCVDSLAGFMCHCSEGFRGEFCQHDIDECVSGDVATFSSGDNSNTSIEITSSDVLCSEYSTCTNTFGSFICTCNRGYTGDGFKCTDLNECEEMGISKAAEEASQSGIAPCHVNATCFNLVGNYDCECNRGYIGSGFQCEEIDECASTPCKHGGTCMDQLAAFSCMCPIGYRGLLCENDINECNDGTHDCDPQFGRCINANGSHTCVCRDGFLGTGKSCTDIDECEGPHDCDATENSHCKNSIGSYQCPCVKGYEKIEGKCNDVDECEIGNHQCTGLYEECNNTIGGYTCKCRAPAVKIDGKCEEIVAHAPLMQGDSNTWTNIANTMKKPRMLAIAALTVVLLIASLALIIKVVRRRKSGSLAISNAHSNTDLQRRGSVITENVTL